MLARGEKRDIFIVFITKGRIYLGDLLLKNLPERPDVRTGASPLESATQSGILNERYLKNADPR